MNASLRAEMQPDSARQPCEPKFPNFRWTAAERVKPAGAANVLVVVSDRRPKLFVAAAQTLAVN